jgi:hypothetical protein
MICEARCFVRIGVFVRICSARFGKAAKKGPGEVEVSADGIRRKEDSAVKVNGGGRKICTFPRRTG